MYKVFESRSGIRYLYESTTNGIFELSPAECGALPARIGTTDALACLDKERMIFSDERELSSNYSTFRECYFETDCEAPELLVLEMTQQCNFRCSYCIYSGSYPLERTHTSKRMRRADIDVIVEKYFHGSSHPRYVSFYGGEPLLNFGLIKEFCSTVSQSGVSPCYSMATNGFLLQDDDIVAFLVNYDFRLNISYDGINHDRYRRTVGGEPTADCLIELLRKINDQYPGYLEKNVTLSITLAPPYCLKENALFFSNDPFLSRLKMNVSVVNDEDCLFVDDFDLASEHKQLVDDLTNLADWYIDYQGELPQFFLALFAVGLKRIDDREMSLQTKAFPPGQCVPGFYRRFITSFGQEYMCERVGSYGFLGSVYERSNNESGYQAVVDELDEVFSERCPKCYLSRVCDMCCSSLRRGDSLKDVIKINQTCEQRRRWFDLIFYIYLSRKELGKGLF